MSTIVTRSGKGSPLSHAEVDSNFTNLNTDKLQSGDTAAALTITSADINGGTIDGVTLGTNSAVTEAQIDNINVNGNAITSTNTDGNIAITPNGTGEVDISKVDIDGGTIDGTVIGGSTPAAATVTQLNSGPLAGFRNAIINGGFDIWQRGTSFTGSEYGADRWVHSRTGTTVTASRQAFTLGQTDVPGEPQYYLRSVVTSSAGVGNQASTQQRIESVRTFAGQTVTVSFYAKADGTKPIAMNLLQSFGTGGSPSTAVVVAGQKQTLTTSWQLVTKTFSIPSISGKTIGTDGNDYLSFIVWYDAGSDWDSYTDSLGQQSGTFEIGEIQIELGSVATPFERRPIGTELALCQRYLPAWNWSSGNDLVGHGHSFDTDKSFIHIPFPVTPRRSPTGISVTNAGNFTLRNGSNVGGAATSIVFAMGGSLSMGQVQVNTTAGSPTIAAGDGAWLFASAAAQILFTGCEL